MSVKPAKAIEVFYSYSHKDEELRDELEKHLSILKRQGVITGWHDRRIGAGREWEAEIDTHLNTAHIILLLISADFLASDYCYDVEMKRAIERHEAKEARVIPVMLRPCDWKGAPFGKLQALPKDAKPVSSWSDRDQAFLNVAQGIRATVEELAGSSASPHAVSEKPSTDREVAAPEQGSGRLRFMKVFISYKRNVEPDEPLALRVYEALREHCEVFIDQTLLVGTAWAERIQAELETCDYLIPLLSEHSVHSEMVETEIRTAHRLGKEGAGKPGILPIRVAYREPFEYPLSAYLDRINWAFWESEADTEPLIEELLAAIAGGELSIAGGTAKSEIIRPAKPIDLPRPRPSASPIRLELPNGTMDPESRFYIEREGDVLCQADIARQGVTITIKAPRQVGKSSLLVRTMARAAAAGKAVIFLDFQLFDRATLESPEAFFRTFCNWITDELDLADETDRFWEPKLGCVLRCTRYFKRHVLQKAGGSLVLAMDEVDRMFDCSFRSDFFGMLRSWHNSRRPGNEWKRLDLALIISTEPYLLIDDLNQSPFNVGQVIELDDFTPDQVRDLNARHGYPFSEAELTRLMALIGGHPYLVRRALYLVASGQMDAEAFLANATRDDGPFGDHLRRHLFRFRDKPDLRQAMAQILAHNTCPDDLLFFRLRGAGLARRAGSAVVPRYGLYTTYFRERFHV